jgi:hypothetical protein
MPASLSSFRAPVTPGRRTDSIIDKNSWVKFTSFASVQSFAISSHRANRWGS